MKIKYNPVLYILFTYICLGAYLLISFYSLQQYLSSFALADLRPVATGLLVLGLMFLVLPLLSMFRIPFFYYLFKMVHLWIVIASGLLLWLYFKFGALLTQVFNVNTPQSIATVFPVTQAEMFTPFISLIQAGITKLQTHYIQLLLVMTLVMAAVQFVMYLPSSLRYVYYTHISPLRYSFKHILVSLLLFVPVLFVLNLYLKSDSSLNPHLESLLASADATVNESDNAFYPLLGLWLPEVPNRIAYGKQWVSDYHNMLARASNPQDRTAYARLNLSGMKKADQGAINQLYVQWLQSNTAEIPRAILNYKTQYQNQLDTLASVYHLKAYQNPLVFTEHSYTEFYTDYRGSFLALERLSLLSYLIKASSDVNAFRNLVSDDYYFNIRTIKASSDLRIKLLYTEKQSLIQQFLYKLLQSHSFQDPRFYSLINRLPVLTTEVLDQKLIAQKSIVLLKSQLDLARQRISDSSTPTAILLEYTFKYNKTMNCIYSRADAKYNLHNLNLASLISRPPAVTLPSALDNVVGNIICKAGIPASTQAFDIYAGETNGRMMILKAQSRLFEDKVSKANIATYLNNHSSKYYNPFTGGPLKWDRDNRQIYFEYTRDKDVVRVSL